jgi:hypothetical protein
MKVAGCGHRSLPPEPLPMSPAAQAILAHLQSVSDHRQAQAQDPLLARRVQAIKRHQHQRFEQTYADQGADPRTAAAADFFLTDLYGPGDFSARDQQFGRIVPTLDRLFPANIVRTVQDLAELHALSDRLDLEMGHAIEQSEVDDPTYARAWRQVGQPAQRERQIDLMLEVGRALAGFTRNPLLRHSLRLMRKPAQLAGLDALHTFLERGFDTFRRLPDPTRFLETIAQRERALAADLFRPGPSDRDTPPDPGTPTPA